MNMRSFLKDVGRCQRGGGDHLNHWMNRNFPVSITTDGMGTYHDFPDESLTLMQPMNINYGWARGRYCLLPNTHVPYRLASARVARMQ